MRNKHTSNKYTHSEYSEGNKYSDHKYNQYKSNHNPEKYTDQEFEYPMIPTVIYNDLHHFKIASLAQQLQGCKVGGWSRGGFANSVELAQV